MSLVTLENKTGHGITTSEGEFPAGKLKQFSTAEAEKLTRLFGGGVVNIDEQIKRLQEQRIAPESIPDPNAAPVAAPGNTEAAGGVDPDDEGDDGQSGGYDGLEGPGDDTGSSDDDFEAGAAPAI